MINDNSTFEDILIKVIGISERKDFIEIEYDADKTIWVGGIYLDDHYESDDYMFDWEIGNPFYLQSEETKQTLRFLLIEHD